MIGKRELVKRVAIKRCGTANNVDESDLRNSARFLDELEEVITEALLSGEKVFWKGFISIEVTERGKRKGVNLATGDTTVYPPVKSIKCRISKKIKDMVKGRG